MYITLVIDILNKFILDQIPEYYNAIYHSILNITEAFTLPEIILRHSSNSTTNFQYSHGTFIYTFLAILSNILIAWGTYFFYSRKKKRERCEVYERSKSLIANEIIFNTKQIQAMLMRPKWRPYDFLNTSAKEALWRKVLDILTDIGEEDSNNIRLIDELYILYNSVNRQISILFEQGITAPIYHQSTIPLVRQVFNTTIDIYEKVFSDNRLSDSIATVEKSIMGGLKLIETSRRNYLPRKIFKDEVVVNEHEDFRSLQMSIQSFSFTNSSQEQDIKSFAELFLRTFKDKYLGNSDMIIDYTRNEINASSACPSAIHLSDYSISTGLSFRLVIPIKWTSSSSPPDKDRWKEEAQMHHRTSVSFSLNIVPGIGGAYISSEDLCFGANVDIGNKDLIRELSLDIGDMLYNYLQITKHSLFTTINRHQDNNMLNPQDIKSSSSST